MIDKKNPRIILPCFFLRQKINWPGGVCSSRMAGSRQTKPGLFYLREVKMEIRCDSPHCPGHESFEISKDDYIYDAGKVFLSEDCRQDYWEWINKNIRGVK